MTAEALWRELLAVMMHDITAGLSWARAALPDELATRAPSRLRGHLRGDWMADRARAQSDTGEQVHSQHDSTWSLTISQKLQIRFSRNFVDVTVLRKHRNYSKEVY